MCGVCSVFRAASETTTRRTHLLGVPGAGPEHEPQPRHAAFAAGPPDTQVHKCLARYTYTRNLVVKDFDYEAGGCRYRSR